MRFEEYFEPQTIEECIRLKQELGSAAIYIAGGTDVMPKLNDGVLRPKAVISLHKIKEMHEVSGEEDGLRIGALAPLREIALSGILGSEYDVIREAAGHVSSMQVRNIATIGGNVCNASPSADAVQGLMVLDAVCRIQGLNGYSEKPLSEFFTGPGETILAEEDLLTGFFVPRPAERTGAAHIKFSIRGNIDISIVGAAAAITLNDEGIAEKVRISLAAVAPTPLRVTSAESFLTGKKMSSEVFEEAAGMAENACSPIDDQRASAGYRREMVKVHTRIALEEAYKKISQEG